MKIIYDFREEELLEINLLLYEDDTSEDCFLKFTNGFDILEIGLDNDSIKQLKNLCNSALKKIKEIRRKNDR